MGAELSNEFRVGDFIANRDLNILIGTESSQSLEPKVMEVLCYFVAHPEQVISRQELMDALWSSQVSDGAVSRTVGLLRKALHDNAESPNYIQTIAKKGYRFIATVEPIALEPKDAEQNDKALNSQPINRTQTKLKAVMAIAVSSFIVLYWQYSNRANETALQIGQPQFIQLTNEQGFEYDPNLSFDEKWLVYRHRQTLNEQYNIYLKNLQTLQTIQLTDSVEDDRAPTFSPDKSKVVFTRKAPGKCAIMLLKLDPKGYPVQANSVYRCGAFEHYSNVAWAKDGRSIYFTDRESAEQPYHIHKLHLATGRVEKVTNGLNNYYGDNELSVSPSGKYLAFFRNKYWGNNQVYILNLETGEERKLVELGFLAWNISWTSDERHLLYSDNRIGGTLKLISIDDASIEPVFYAPRSIISPELSATGSAIVYATETADVDLWRVSLDSLNNGAKPMKMPVSSSRADEIPAISEDGDKLIFVSDRNGSSQLWLLDKDSLKVMDGLQTDSRIDEISWHPNGRQVLVAFSDKTINLLDTENNTSQLVDIGDKKAGFPQFSKDGKNIYFSSDASGDWQIWSYQLKNKNLTQITKAGGYRVNVNKNGQIYFTKYRQPGIWRLNLKDGIEEKIINEIVRSDNFAVCDNRIIYEVNDAQTQVWMQDSNKSPRQLVLSVPKSTHLRFSASKNCSEIIFSKWQNIESDIMMIKL